MMTPKVSVIIRTYQGRLNFLRHAIDSVIHQTYRPVELIVVEDGSTEASTVLEKISAAEPTLEVVHIQNPKLGRSQAGNTALKAATGLFINFLDDDDEFYPHHLSTLVAHMIKNRNLIAAYALADEKPTQILSLDPLQLQEKAPCVVYNKDYKDQSLLEENYLPIQSVLFKKEAYEKLSGFHDKLDRLEDWHLWAKYSLLGPFEKVGHTPTSFYRVPMSNEDKMKQHRSWLASLEQARQQLIIDIQQQRPDISIAALRAKWARIDRTRKRNLLLQKAKQKIKGVLGF